MIEIARVGIGLEDNLHDKQERIYQMTENTSSGVVGVGRAGSGAHLYWRAQLEYNGEIHRKTFPYTDGGLQRAIAQRKEWERERSEGGPIKPPPSEWLASPDCNEDGVKEVKPMKDALTIDYLSACFELHEGNGQLLWKARPRNHFPDLYSYEAHRDYFEGREAVGLKESDGDTIGITCEGCTYFPYKRDLIFALHNKRWGKALKHLNKDIRDCRIKNLYETRQYQCVK